MTALPHGGVWLLRDGCRPDGRCPRCLAYMRYSSVDEKWTCENQDCEYTVGRLDQHLTPVDDVFVLTIEHKHGSDSWVATDQDALTGCLYDFVSSWWEQELGDIPMPDDHDEAIQQYFTAMGGIEFRTVTTAKIHTGAP